MSTLNTDLLIQQVDRRRYNRAEWNRLIADKIIVIVDANTQEILPRVPIIRIGRDIRTYIIDLEEQIEVEGIEVSIRDFNSNQSVTLKISYEASIAEGGAKKLIKAILDEPNPKLAIQRKIESWIKKFSKRQENFIGKYLEIKGELKRDIASRAEDEMGLDLFPLINLREVPIEDEVFKNQIVKVLVDDSNKEFVVYFNALIRTLGQENPNHVLAPSHLHRKKERQDLIEHTISTCFVDYKIQEIIDNLNGSITDTIKNQVNPHLSKHGREIKKLDLQFEYERVHKTESFFVQHSFGKERFLNPIQITSDVRMRVFDHGKFEQEKIRQNIASLSDWVNETIKDLTNSHLFRASYVDLVLAFRNQGGRGASANSDAVIDESDYLGNIRRGFRERANEIGYEDEVLIIEPILPEIQYTREGFTVQPIEKAYATKTPEISVNIQFVISGKIIDLKRIENLISENVDITDRIRKQAEGIIADIVHKLPPNEAMLNFSNTIENPVVAKVGEILREQYAVDDFSRSITIKQAENSLRKRFNDLGKGFRTTEILVQPKYMEGRHEEFTCKLSYKVKGVHPDHWFTFQNNQLDSLEEELIQIDKIFAGAVKSVLELEPDGAREALTTGIIRVKEQTGLLVDPFDFYTGKGIASQTASDIYKEKLQERKVREIAQFIDKAETTDKQLKTLREKRGILLLSTDEEEMEELRIIEEQIKKLEAEVEEPFETPVNENMQASAKPLDTSSLLKEAIKTSNLIENPQANSDKEN